MHPHASFAWQDEEQLLAFVAQVAFCTIFLPAHGGAVVHAPVTVEGGRLRFHIARNNRAVGALDSGESALFSCLGPDAYLSPDWYGSDDQVPTWNYVAVEGAGTVRRMDEAELVAQIDALSAAHESRLAPKRPWTRHKMSPGRFDTMIKAIVGFEFSPTEVRGTRKLSQNKSPGERNGALAGLEAAGRNDLAQVMRAASRPT